MALAENDTDIIFLVIQETHFRYIMTFTGKTTFNSLWSFKNRFVMVKKKSSILSNLFFFRLPHLKEGDKL